MMDVPAALIAAFPPSATLLLDLARRPIDNDMLLQVARADYGNMIDEMMAELRPIRDEGIIPFPMHWQLKEVLSLTRWCNPEVPNRPPFEPGPTGRRGHQIRLFVCALLLRAKAERAIDIPEPFDRETCVRVLMRAQAERAIDDIDNSEDSSLANCLVSAHVLGEEMSLAAARFLTWLIPRTWYWSDPLLFSLALLILATRLRTGRIPDAVLGDAANWVLSEESCWRTFFGPDNPADPRPAPFSVGSGFWQPLAAELHREAETVRTEDVRTKLQVCELILEP